jgi:hypothetical protein
MGEKQSPDLLRLSLPGQAFDSRSRRNRRVQAEDRRPDPTPFDLFRSVRADGVAVE